MSTADTRKRTRRIVDVAPTQTYNDEFGFLDETYDAPEVGAIYCLVEWADLDPAYDTPPDKRRGNTLTKNPRTNMSRNVLWSGWLGTTDSIHRYALGAYRVVSADKWSGEWDDVPKWRVSLAPAEEPDEEEDA